MLRFAARRLAQTLLVVLAAAFVAFALFNFAGDPVNSIAGDDATLAQREAIRHALGLDRPFTVQFARFVGNALGGDFGNSYRLGLPVRTLIAERLPASLELVTVASLLAIVIGVPLGVYAALFRDHPMSRLLISLTVLGVSLPTFLVGILLITLFSVSLRWLPSLGRGEVVDLGIWTTGLLTASGRRALVLPSVTLAWLQLALIARLVRSGMVEVLRADYVRFARARGLSRRVVLFRHALPNTLVPLVTSIGMQVGTLIAFAVVTESVFQWPGLGALFLQSAQFADVPVLVAYLCLVALLFGLLNLCVDLLYGVLDPRIRAAYSERARA